MPDDNGPRRPLRFPTRLTGAEEFGALADRIQQERAEAAQGVERILRQVSREDLSALVERPELLTCGAVEQLGKLVDTELSREPKYAERLAMLAVSLSEILPAAYHRIMLAQIRAHAWKDLGKVRASLGRYDEAFAAFHTAETYADAGALTHDLALVRLNLGIAYQDVGRLDEAHSIFIACKEVFRGFGDMRLFVLAGFYEGVILQRFSHYRQARETYLLLLVSTNEIAKDTLAALHQAIGICSIELGDYDDAESHLERATALHLELRQPIAVMKGEFARGRLMIRRGFPRQGIAHLEPVRHHFLEQSLAEEAALCGLDMVEGMLLLGNSHDAERLTQTIMSEFLAASLAKKAAPKIVQAIREYVLLHHVAPEPKRPRSRGSSS
jgi:tetratricopeptide (TPR) repeat protein